MQSFVTCRNDKRYSPACPASRGFMQSGCPSPEPVFDFLSRIADKSDLSPELLFAMKTKGIAELKASQCSIENAAKASGLDSFTMYALIQQQRLKVNRTPWGEIVLRQTELQRLLKRPTTAQL